MVGNLYLKAKIFFLALFLKDVSCLAKYISFEEEGEYYTAHLVGGGQIIYFSYANEGMREEIAYFNTNGGPRYILVWYFNSVKKYKELTNES